MPMYKTAVTAKVATLCSFVAAEAQEICEGYGPQAPRDISVAEGINARIFDLAPAPERMNLCDIHTHTNAEHRGPGFTVAVDDGTHGGFACDISADLTEDERSPYDGEGHFEEVAPGDTIEVHWVFTSCESEPGPGLASCMTNACMNPQLRVESQVFLVVNDPEAADFSDYTLAAEQAGGYYQPKSLPEGTGTPVEYTGSTTGPRYNELECSPLQVSWSVRPQCAKLDIGSLYRWGADNAFGEDHSHGVRELVRAPALLSAMN